MSRPITPVPKTMDTLAAPTSAAPGSSKPASYLGADSSHIDHANQAPEYLVDNDDPTDPSSAPDRPASQMSQSATYIPSRGNTLKKKSSLRKTGSVKRSTSRRSSYAGSVRSMKLGEKEKYEPEPADYNSAFYCPVPTTSSPTELLANRFQAWRFVLKSLINYFRDLHKGYETRSKSLISASNVISNITMPVDFLNSGGIGDAASILAGFHKQAMNEANKARDLENEVIAQLTGLRSDLSQKIKEIKGLSGDFKNSVHKEQEGTRRAINAFQEALGTVDRDAAAAAGKGDPFLIKLGVERQLERQIEEENYLHRAFLNLEASGRELESIVVGEIQKAYNVLAGILKRDADTGYDTAEKLREGPLAMPRDHEWDAYVTNNPNMVDPRHPLRQVKNIDYEGKDHPAAIEVKSGMLERKSKYLKNYTPGWYILSPTHLHEFKSADQIPFQAPVMSLYLPEQKLGSHSEPNSSSHKFMIKGRQTGSMHRGHTWIFRAETHDTMMAWFSDITQLTEKRGEARNEFVRRTHARSVSRSSRAASIGSGDSQMDEDEADKVAFSGEQSVRGLQVDQSRDGSIFGAGDTSGSGLARNDSRSEAGWRPQRPQPGGRFPSDVNVTRGLQAPLSRSSGDSGDEPDRETIVAATALPGSAIPYSQAADFRHAPTDIQHSTRHDTASTISSLDNTATFNNPGVSSYTSPPPKSETTGTAGIIAVPDTTKNTREMKTTGTTDTTGATGVTGHTGNTYDTGSTGPAIATGYSKSASNTYDSTAGHASNTYDTSATRGLDSTDDTGAPAGVDYTAGEHPNVAANPTGAEVSLDTQSQYREWVGAGLTGAGVGAAGVAAVEHHREPHQAPEIAKEEPAITTPAVPAPEQSSAPVTSATTIPVHRSSIGDGIEEPPRLMASAYQATTMPATVDPVDTGFSTSTKEVNFANGGYVGGTDIRAPTGSGLYYSSTTTAEPASISRAAEPVKTEQSTIPGVSSTGPSYTSTSDYSSLAGTTIRPSPVHSKSIQTISDLHIPGEFPRGPER